MTKEVWIEERAALHKSGNHKYVKEVKDKWLQIRDQRTKQGNIVTTAIDITHLRAHAEDLIETYRVSKPIDDFKASNDYRKVTLRGIRFHLGDIQAKIIKQLHEVSLTNNPWVHGKTLIHNAGSKVKQLNNIFSNKFVWKALIESDGNGFYRLSLL